MILFRLLRTFSRSKQTPIWQSEKMEHFLAKKRVLQIQHGCLDSTLYLGHYNIRDSSHRIETEQFSNADLARSAISADQPRQQTGTPSAGLIHLDAFLATSQRQSPTIFIVMDQILDSSMTLLGNFADVGCSTGRFDLKFDGFA